MKKIFRKFIAKIRRTFVADCPSCHLHFFGFHNYAIQKKINNRHYRIVCHRCVEEHVKLDKLG